MEDRRRNYGGVVWPVILIGAGVVFLLNNIGVLGWDVWATLLKLWPVLLVAVGLDILIGRRSALGSAIVALLMIVVLAGAIWLGAPNRGVSTAAIVDRTEQLSADLKEAAKADVTIAFGTGSLLVSALPQGSAKLIEGSADLSKDEHLSVSQTGTGGAARYAIRSENAWISGTRVLETTDDKVWDLSLNRDIPLALELSTGIGKSNLDLVALQLSRLEINGGVGQVTAKLPQNGRYSVEIDGGVGEIILILPQQLGARIRIDGGLGGADVQGDFDRQDREYTTRGYGSATNRADIRISGGLGRVQVRQAIE